MRVDPSFTATLLAVAFAGTAFASGELASEPDATAEPASIAENAPIAENGPAPEVARSIVTTAIAEREPVDRVDRVTTASDQIFFFTELLNLDGHSVTHRWERGGEVMGEVPFAVGGARWRVWSSKNLDPSWTGEWTVSVIAEDGSVLESETFTYTEAAAPAPAAPAP